MAYRISVDTGGTFTDVVVVDDRGQLRIGKALTTPRRAFEGISAALDNVAPEFGLTASALLADTETFTYGTTRATQYGYSLWELSVNTDDGGTGPVIPPTDPRNPNLGPNTFVFDPSTPQSTIQSRLNTIAAQMRTNQFGTQRYAVLFKPGNYNADVDLRFYTQVAGLGLLPDQVNLNGHVRVEADWLQQGDNPNNLGNATQNFWRSAENLSVTLPAGQIERCSFTRSTRGSINWRGGAPLSEQRKSTRISGLLMPALRNSSAL